jgi:hypothetical protein
MPAVRNSGGGSVAVRRRRGLVAGAALQGASLVAISPHELGRSERR